MHAEISGTVDFKEPNDDLCLKRLRSLVGKNGKQGQGPERHFRLQITMPAKDAPKYAAEDLYGLIDPAPAASNVYDMREVIARIVDRSEFDEYKAEFGRTVMCGYARIGGRAVGIVANQKLNQRRPWRWGRWRGRSASSLAA
jgi:3-methylcrotonyl-CoA carboxylase beta subunit